MALTPQAVLSLAASAFPLFFALVFVDSRIVRVFFFPAVFACVYSTATTYHDVTIWTWSALLVAIASDLLLVTDAGMLRAPGQKIPAYSLSVKERCKWAFSLIVSMRRIGFTYGDPPKDQRSKPSSQQPMSRWQFAFHQLKEFIKVYTVMDIAHGCMLWMDACRQDPVLVSQYGSLFDRLRALAALVAARGFTGLAYVMISGVLVAIGLSEPSSWPPGMHGEWSDAYTIRRFWGRTWHQLLRRVVSVHGEFASSSILRLKPGGFLGNSVARFVAFYVSGLIHSFGYHGTLVHHWGDLGFYVWQAAGIGLEELVMGFVISPKPCRSILNISLELQ